jgi:protein-L-isoaspartate(D-aspartate) O-methyltransferase
MELKEIRASFAEELRYVAHVRSDRLITAFATVPREHFLGAPPWQVFDLQDGCYWVIPGDDPACLYHNVLVAIDAARRLNNGHPEFWARLLDKLEIRPGDSIYHIGAGVGYYTAIMAELAGPEGKILAAEIDPALADRARTNLASRPNVQVVAADGARADPGPVDVIVVNAGATHPLPVWLNAMMPDGRLLLPLTAEGWRGSVFRIDRLPEPNRYTATVVSGVQIYPCTSARTPLAAQRLSRALGEGGQRFVRSLRIDDHAPDRTCWLHGDGYCFSTRAANPSRHSVLLPTNVTA